jgi:hypothetical protein
MSAPDDAHLAIDRLTVLIGDELKAMQRLMRGVPQPLPQTTIDELAAGELPRRVLVNVDLLDADDMTIATGAIEWIVEVAGPSGSGRR